MADIFVSQPGAVLVVSDPDLKLSPVQVVVDGLSGRDGGYNVSRCLVTSVGLHQATAHQFLHTLRDFVYVYVFGERLADMTLTGLCVLNPCEGDANGLDNLYGFYQSNRLSIRDRPVQVLIGDRIHVNAFLVDVRLGVQDVQNRLGQFSLEFRYLPEGNR